MTVKRSPSREVYSELGLQKLPMRRPVRWIVLTIAVCVMALIIGISLFLRKLSSEFAMSDAVDAGTLAVNDSIAETLREHDYTYEYFVTLEKDSAGSITAVTTNTKNINLLSAELLQKIVKSADNQNLDIRIPLGNLLGSNLLLGKGPDIPVEIIMLTSSFVSFDNQLFSTGINQTKHVITMKVDVDVDILVPWDTITTTVESDILIAETVIVGRVPETFVSVTEDTYGQK